MTRLLVDLLPYIILGLFVLAVVAFLVALQQLRRGRTGPYWRIRRAAGQRGGQLFLLSIALLGIGGALALFSGLGDLAYRRLMETLNNDPDVPKGVVLPTLTEARLFTPTPTISDTPSPTPTLSATPTRITETPNSSPTRPPTLTLTATFTPSITATPTATFESVLALTPEASARQPRTGASIEIVAAAGGISPDEKPLDPSQEFQAGIQRIYLFINYRRMDDGIGWSRILFRDGVPIQGQSYLWSLGETGSSYFFFGSDQGYPAGDYEARLFLGEAEVNRFTFTVVAA